MPVIALPMMSAAERSNQGENTKWYGGMLPHRGYPYMQRMLSALKELWGELTCVPSYVFATCRFITCLPM